MVLDDDNLFGVTKKLIPLMIKLKFADELTSTTVVENHVSLFNIEKYGVSDEDPETTPHAQETIQFKEIENSKTGVSYGVDIFSNGYSRDWTGKPWEKFNGRWRTLKLSPTIDYMETGKLLHKLYGIVYGVTADGQLKSRTPPQSRWENEISDHVVSFQAHDSFNKLVMTNTNDSFGDWDKILSRKVINFWVTPNKTHKWLKPITTIDYLWEDTWSANDEFYAMQSEDNKMTIIYKLKVKNVIVDAEVFHPTLWKLRQIYKRPNIFWRNTDFIAGRQSENHYLAKKTRRNQLMMINDQSDGNYFLEHSNSWQPASSQSSPRLCDELCSTCEFSEENCTMCYADFELQPSKINSRYNTCVAMNIAIDGTGPVCPNHCRTCGGLGLRCVSCWIADDFEVAIVNIYHYFCLKSLGGGSTYDYGLRNLGQAKIICFE